MPAAMKGPISISFVARFLGLKFEGSDKIVSGLNSLDEASESEISFFTNSKYAEQLKNSKACAVIISEEFAEKVPNALISKDPYMDFAKAGAIFAKKQGEFKGLSKAAYIDESAELGEGCTVYPNAFIGPRVKMGKNCEVFPAAYIGEDTVMGDGCIIYPNAVIMAGVILGNNCVLKPGAVLGSDGFGFVRIGKSIQTIPQTGKVVLEDGVVIGANTCIDKAHIGTTYIAKDTKMDNLVQIGHNVKVGEQSLIISQVGIAGSCVIGDRATIAGQTGIAGHLKIGDDVIIAAKSGVATNIESGSIGGGIPFMSRKAFSRNLVLMPKVPELFRQVANLEKKLSALENTLSALTKEKE